MVAAACGASLQPRVDRARGFRVGPEGSGARLPGFKPIPASPSQIPVATPPARPQSSVVLTSPCHGPCHNPRGALFVPTPACPSGLPSSLLPDPCHNGGSCTDGINMAFCDCLAGFQGTFCEEDINECASSPCRNGANCTDCVASYTCTCPTGFSGIHCENNTPDCTERWVGPWPWGRGCCASGASVGLRQGGDRATGAMHSVWQPVYQAAVYPVALRAS